VLEGVGLIEKKSKNNIMWKPCSASQASNDTENGDQMYELVTQQIAQLRVSGV
jgi:hypothetical protein